MSKISSKVEKVYVTIHAVLDTYTRLDLYKDGGLRKTRHERDVGFSLCVRGGSGVILSLSSALSTSNQSVVPLVVLAQPPSLCFFTFVSQRDPGRYAQHHPESSRSSPTGLRTRPFSSSATTTSERLPHLTRRSGAAATSNLAGPKCLRQARMGRPARSRRTSSAMS